MCDVSVAVLTETQTSDLNFQRPDNELPVLTAFRLIYYLITQTHDLISQLPAQLFH